MRILRTLLLTAPLFLSIVGCTNARQRIQDFFNPINETLLVAAFYLAIIIVLLGLGELLISQVSTPFAPFFKTNGLVSILMRFFFVLVGIFVATQARTIVSALLNFFA